MKTNFNNIFLRLREILRTHSGKFSVKSDSRNSYCLEGGPHPVHGKSMPIAWVQINKNYVSFHHMGIYACPNLLDDISPQLMSRMQGKSCFNFKVSDEVVFKELEALTGKAFVVFTKPGYLQTLVNAAQQAAKKRRAEKKVSR